MSMGRGSAIGGSIGKMGRRVDANDTGAAFQINQRGSGGLLSLQVDNSEVYAIDASGFGQHPDGSASGPSITFSSDTDTGLYRIGADTLGVAIGGSEAVRVTSTAIGVNEASPQARIHITDDQAALTSIRLDNTDASGSMALDLYDGSNQRAQFHYDIASALLTVGTTIASGQLSLQTNNGTEAVRIDASQNVTMEGNLTFSTASTISTDAGDLTLDSATNDIVVAVTLLKQTSANSVTQIAGGDAASTGGNVMFFGQSHSSRPNEVLLRSGSTIRIGIDGTGIGFFDTTPVAQQTAPAALTDNSGGTADDTIEAVSGSGADSAINNNFAELADEVAQIRTVLVNLGLAA